MLQEVMEYIHNYFVKTPHQGTFTIADGVISPMPALKEGQRFMIYGSNMNDGVYTYSQSGILDDDDMEAAGLQDETYAGAICELAVPPTVIALSGEIKEWVEKYQDDVVNSPYASESFNGYSYSLKTGSTASGGDGGPVSWHTIYGKRLERWRRPWL